MVAASLSMFCLLIGSPSLYRVFLLGIAYLYAYAYAYVFLSPDAIVLNFHLILGGSFAPLCIGLVLLLMLVVITSPFDQCWSLVDINQVSISIAPKIHKLL